MKIFFDTEFTGLHKDTTLISLGIVAEDGKTFYAEFSDYNKEQVEDDIFIQNNVINNCIYIGKNVISIPYINRDENHTSCYGTKDMIKNILTEWLQLFDNVELVSDVCHYDMVLFIDIFGTAFDIPNNVCPSCHDINQDISSFYLISEKEAFDYSREAIVKNMDDVSIYDMVCMEKHNALYDAHVIKKIYEYIISQG